MLAEQTRPESTPPSDRTTRTAALWATAVAVPVTVLAAAVLFSVVRDRTEPAVPKAAVSSPTAVMPTTAVGMPAPALAEGPATVCRRVLSQLPAAIRGLPQRPVTAGPEQNAAYGDPAVTVACGVPRPSVPAGTVLMTMDNVCWFPQQRAGATVFTTLGREVPVQVTVPAAYDQAAQWANEFSDTVVATVASSRDAPQDCA